MLEKIRGTIDRIVWRNEENGWTVARLMEGEEGETHGRETTIVGTIPKINCGETVALQGEWVNNKKFGKQFQVSIFQVTIPETVMGIRKYLGSGLIKGIGREMSQRIVDKFKENTIKIIETDIGRLTEVDGIGAKRVDMIRKSWKEQKHIKEIMIFLQGKGVPTGIATRIYKKYGNKSLEVLESNPYRVVDDIWGIGFKSADLIAQKLGIPHNSDIRARAGLIYTLSEASGTRGHTYLDHGDLIHQSQKLLGIAEWSILENALKHQIEDGKLIEINKRLIFLTHAYDTEKNIAENLIRLKGNINYNINNIEENLKQTQGKLSIELSDTQKIAVKTALTSKMMILTGGPGTGKSTIINTIINILIGKRILLAAPTGRAAKRMSEITEREAKTIHRLLDYSPRNGGFNKNENNKLFADLIIIDESSMIDIYLMSSLLKAVPNNCAIIFVGDVDQLPSVGTGNVLKDMINSGFIKTIRLTDIFRQAAGSKIISNAHAINRGIPPHLKNIDNSDFYFYSSEEPENINIGIIKLLTTVIPNKFKLNPVKDVQVLSPMRKGIIGINTLNDQLQTTLNKNKIILTRGFTKYRLNDKVMQIKNNYDKNVFNGDVGYIKSHNIEDQEIVIDFDGKLIEYDYSELDEIVLAYAVSIHKSQGSEYPCVIIPIHTTHFIMLKRNLLYTGITRAKKLIFLLGSRKAIDIAVKNNDIAKRNTYLTTLIKEI